MFIEIKLEPKDYDAHKTPRDAALSFKLENDATIKEIKSQISKHIGVPAENQEIRALSETYNNNDKIYEILELDKKLETTVMLYIYNSDDSSESFCDGTNGEPKFYCFLHLCDNEKVEKLFRKKPNNDITKKIIVLSDSESNEEGTTTTASSSLSDSDESMRKIVNSKNSAISGKRSSPSSNSEKSVKKQKRVLSVNSKFSSTLNSYLDEFPKYTTTDNNSKQCNKKLQENREEEQIANIIAVQSSSTTIQSQGISSNNDLKKEVQCNATSSSSAESYNPYVGLSPEKREYMIIIRNEKDMCNLNSSDFNELLNLFFDRFRQSDSDIPASRLQFNENSAIILFEGKVWISCDDELSFQWISKNIKQFTLKYKAERLRDFFQLQKCVVIIPGICKSKKFEEIFDLLEKQNCNLSTKQWVLKERRVITDENDEYFQKAVSHISCNYVIFLFIDKESKELLEKMNYKLKYCFWKIVFEMKEFKEVIAK